jgi:hypothetical protein
VHHEAFGARVALDVVVLLHMFGGLTTEMHAV